MEKVLGSTFAYHPEFTTATMVVSGPSHPSTEGLPHRWQVQDEIYNFVQDPRDEGAIVVLTADETSYNDPGDRSPSQGTPHPITWYQEHLKGTNTTGPIGRSWYTGLGHSNASWVDDTFLGHVLGGISWALASNTTRWINPAGTVGSLGPIYETPAEAAPTTTLDSDSSALSLPQPLGLSSLLVGITCLLVASWSL
jgi:type 1 glutamine amidotransferase